MAASTPSTIMLSDVPVFTRDEAQADNVAITPGSLLEPVGAKVKLHATAGGNAQPLFAVENPWSADNSIKSIDTAYGTADTVFYIKGLPGQQVYAWLTVGGSVAADTLLESAGSLGALQTSTAEGTVTAPRRHVARALQTVNNSAGATPARIKVEIL
jgi:hypothetical protein